MVEPQAQDTALLLPFAGPPLALPSSRRAPAASLLHVVHVPVTSQSHRQAITGNGHVREIPPEHPEFLAQLPRSNQRVKGCWGRKKRKKRKHNPPRMR